MAIGLVYLASSQCQLCDREGLFCCSMSAGTATNWVNPSFDGRKAYDYSSLSFRCKIPLFGAMQSYWSTGHDLALSKVRVAADYSDSVPDSSKYIASRGYHPLEEIKDHEKNRELLLTDAEIARTTAEANSKAVLIFPGRVHHEPHGHVSWSEFQYVVDDYGDIYFEFYDDENILEDRTASNPVTVFIGMDSPVNGDTRRTTNNFGANLHNDTIDIFSDDDYDEIVDTEITDTLIKWGMPGTLRHIHPLFFAKCFTKAVDSKCENKLASPSNAISIVGCLRPAFIDEENYLRRLFRDDNDEEDISDWRDESEKEEEQMAGAYGLTGNGASTISTLYKLEIMSMELFSIYGYQSAISLQDFQDSEPDILAHSASAIIERFRNYGMRCCIALKDLCRKRKKGLIVEEANLIGVDSLGMDVRVFSGLEAQTIRFSFNARVTSESAAEKKITRMLFPRYHRKSSRITDNVMGMS